MLNGQYRVVLVSDSCRATVKKTGKSINADVREDIIKMSRATICFELLDIAG
jgi:hypothetical protein